MEKTEAKKLDCGCLKLDMEVLRDHETNLHRLMNYAEVQVEQCRKQMFEAIERREKIEKVIETLRWIREKI